MITQHVVCRFCGYTRHARPDYKTRNTLGRQRWVGLGENKKKVNAVMLGVGGALPVFTGLQKRAPLWMRKLYLEWFYRMCLEPKRIGQRVYQTTSLFVSLCIKQKLQGTG